MIFMTTSMTIRMDPEIKKESQELFRSLGLDMTTAINLFLRQSLMHRGLPFEVRQPRYNAETEAAMQETRDILAGRKKVKSYASVEEAFQELDAEC